MNLRLRTTIQKDGYGAKAGEIIRGNLARGANGKFTAAGNARAATPKAKGRATAAAQERAALRAQRAAERARKQQQRIQDRAQRHIEQQLKAQLKAEVAAKKKAEAEAKAKAKGGGGGGGKKKDNTQAQKEQARAAERARKERAAARQEKARAAERAAREAQRQAAAAQRHADQLARQQQRDTARSAHAQAQAQRQAASDAARQQREAARAARQQALDARRQALDARRAQMQAQLMARRDAAEARAQAKFAAWQAQQKTTARPAHQAATKAAAAPLAKRAASTPTFTHAFAIAKVDAAARIVEGIASSETPDRQPGLWKGAYYAGDIVDADAIAAALPDYLEYGNIREMHQPSAVGVVISAELRERQLYLVVKVVDDAAWEKVVAGVYKGFSIGGTCDDAAIIKVGTLAYRKITALTLTEISLVDRPANPAARITLWKGTPPMPPTDEQEDTALQKAAGDPTKAIAALQQLRDAAELAGDLGAAQNYSLAIAAALEAAGLAQADDTEPDADDVADEADPAADATDVAMADGLDDLPDEDAVVAMARRIGDIAKVGRTVSSANLAHLSAIHNAITKIAGDTLCKAADDTAEDAALEQAITQAQDTGDLQKVAALEQTIAALQTRLEQLEAQPMPGGPVLRAVEKALPSDSPAPKPVRKSAYRREDLQRLAQTEPNAQLRAQYAAELAALDAA